MLCKALAREMQFFKGSRIEYDNGLNKTTTAKTDLNISKR